MVEVLMDEELLLQCLGLICPTPRWKPAGLTCGSRNNIIWGYTNHEIYIWNHTCFKWFANKTIFKPYMFWISENLIHSSWLSEVNVGLTEPFVTRWPFESARQCFFRLLQHRTDRRNQKTCQHQILNQERIFLCCFKQLTMVVWKDVWSDNWSNTFEALNPRMSKPMFWLKKIYDKEPPVNHAFTTGQP